MALIPTASFPGQIAPASPDYPLGEARNITVPGDNTATPLRADLVNDIFGMQQSFLSAAGLAASGVADKVGASQYLQAIALIGMLTYATAALATTSTHLVKNSAVYLTEREAGWGGGAWWDVVGAGEATTNNTNVIENIPTGYKLVLREGGTVNVRSLAVIPDFRDCTDGMQKALDKWSSIYLPSGACISKALVATQNCTIYGEGPASRLDFKVGEVGALFDDDTYIVRKTNFRMFGGLTSTQKANSVSSADRTGLRMRTQIANRVCGVQIDGFAKYGIDPTDAANGLYERSTVSECVIKNNWQAVNTGGNAGEYARWINNDIKSNYFGIAIRNGNMIVTGNHIDKNGIGVFIDGLLANDGHGTLANNTINHNDINVWARDIDNGYMITGNNIFEGIFRIENSVGVTVTNNILDVTEFDLIGTGQNYIMRNTMFPNNGNTITRSISNGTLIIDNQFTDGTYLEGVSSRSVIIKEADAKVDLDGITTYPTMRFAASTLTSTVFSFEQMADGIHWDNNNATKDYFWGSSAVDAVKIDISTGFWESLTLSGGMVARSPDGTRYKLTPPNGGGAATWVAA